MILVTGASGTVGSALLAELRALGAPARPAYRDPARAGDGAVVLDLADPAGFPAALEGVDAMFLLAPTNPAQTALELSAVAAARAAGVRVVKLSVWRADEGLTPIARLHRPAEEALAASGLRWTLLRPNFYLQNFLRQPTIRTEGVFSLPRIEAPISFADTGDIARVAARVLTTDGHDGRVYDITGPEALTYAEAADRFSAVLGKPVRYLGPPDEEARAAMLARGLPEFQADALIEVARAYRHGGAERVTPVVGELTGRPATTFEEFVRANRAVFSP
ncbi:NAD(P)H-binding protein [Amycolatopsis sp. OK19-0408]|uniref:NAD(P)H-binding protein n=1 Tax=Amycolatopsis iheyensis TaxID=2945988 RepID=A0A9X2N4F6_9PSEU|nr:NAD(P)H-binding protein [Amycolatopsis iheyensis]MCR6481844.1 NAD(P)H-binding protein [Amycolatopsis iheyensis]